MWYISAEKDPVKEMLSVYDEIINEYLLEDDIEFIVATGLSQQPYERLKYYYRLREHKNFLRRIGIDFVAVHPRMTRDFLVEFSGTKVMKDAIMLLSSVRVVQDDIPLFGEIEERDNSAFVTLTYPYEITSTTTFMVNNKQFPLLPEVAFVALKNGMHCSEGFAFFSAGVGRHAPSERQHVKRLHESIKAYFSNTRVDPRIGTDDQGR